MALVGVLMFVVVVGGVGGCGDGGGYGGGISTHTPSELEKANSDSSAESYIFQIFRQIGPDVH